MTAWNDDVWDLVDVAVERLEDAWRSNSNIELGSLLPQPECAERLRVLATLVEIDQEHRWGSGDRRLLEQYLVDWPEFQHEPELLAELLEAECRTRTMVGDTPTHEELQERFPGLAKQTNLQVLLDQAQRECAGSSGDAEHDTTEGPADTGNSSDQRNDDEPTLSAGDRLGRYEIQQMISRGGMATVYLAKDTAFRRVVAVKVPDRSVYRTSDQVQLFLNEAQLAAQLDHPVIVPVYDQGSLDDGTCYLVMKHIQGKPLTESIESGQISQEQAAELTAQVADGLQHAHEKGVYHRDIKPANILIDSEGKPHITDFGLAVHESVQRLRAGEQSGTLLYMPPEQVRGDVHREDGRADIWSLGAVLYEMLTGRRPFSGDTPEQISDEILHGDPKPPRQINRRIHTELQRICLKCLSKRATDRYSSATDLALDLRHWQRPHNRRPLGVIVGLVLALALATACVLAVMLNWPDALQDTARGPLSSEERVDDLPQPPLSIPYGRVPFLVRLEVDHPDRSYREREMIKMAITSEKAGFLYLLYQPPGGEWTCLFPNQLEQNNRIPDHREIALPNPNCPFVFGAAPPFGEGTLKAIVTVEPLEAEIEIQSLIGSPPPPIGQPGARGVFVTSPGRLTKYAEHTVNITIMPAGTVVPVREPRRVGLFIGIGHYMDRRIRCLSATSNDAAGLHEVMMKRCELDAGYLLADEQATLTNIRHAISVTLAEQTGPGDVVFIFWSGMGTRCAEESGDEEEDGFDEALVPYDGVLDNLDTIRSTMVIDDVLARWLQELDGRKVILMLDACHAGGFVSESFQKELNRIGEIGQREITALASCKSGQTAFERREGDFSVFTYSLIELLGTGDGPITLNHAFQQLADRIPVYVTKHFDRTQTPELISTLTQDVYLRPVDTRPTAEPKRLQEAPVTDRTERQKRTSVQLLIWGKTGQNRDRLKLEHPAALPLRAGDRVRIDVQLQHPAYPYVVWIDPQGKAAPLYPWQPGDWDDRPKEERKLAQLSLPQKETQEEDDSKATLRAFPIQGPAGMETLLLLVRDTPLPGDVHLEDLLSGLPEQRSFTSKACAWFADGTLVYRSGDRGPGFDLQTVEDPVPSVGHMVQEIHRRLSPYFQFDRVVSFANRGD